jgi:hypothetical protein
MTEDRYVQWGGVYCPVCHSTNIDADPIDPVSGTEAKCRVTCFSCDSIWLDIYKLTAIEMVKTGRQ